MAPPTVAHHSGQGPGFARHRRRPRALLTDNIHGITNGSIRKLARRGGVVRIQKTIYTTIRDVIEQKLKEILRRIIAIVEYRDRKTVTTIDIIYALKGMPDLHPVYGFPWPIKECPEKRACARPTQPRIDESTDRIIADIRRRAAEHDQAEKVAVHSHGHSYDADFDIDDLDEDHLDESGIHVHRPNSIANIADKEWNHNDHDNEHDIDHEGSESETPSEKMDRWNYTMSMEEEPASDSNVHSRQARLNFPVKKSGMFNTTTTAAAALGDNAK